MIKVLWIALGGSLGALFRHGLSSLAHRLLPPSFPWGTLAANLLGCFLIGALWVLATKYSFSPSARAFVFTGGIGALTTFSTYGLESLMLLRERESDQIPDDEEAEYSYDGEGIGGKLSCQRQGKSHGKKEKNLIANLKEKGRCGLQRGKQPPGARQVQRQAAPHQRRSRSEWDPAAEGP